MYRMLPLLAALIMAGCSRSTDAPTTTAAVVSKTGLGPNGQLTPHPDDRCPVCAMRPHKHPQSVSAMTLKDGRTFYFCGNTCLLQAWAHPTRHLGVPAQAIDRLVVQDYFDGTPIDGHTAFWVAGSDVVEPMGRSVVPLKTSADLAIFTRRHGGDAPFQLKDVAPTQLKERLGR